MNLSKHAKLVQSEHEAWGVGACFQLWCNAIVRIPLYRTGMCTSRMLPIHLTSPLSPAQTGSYANDNELAGSDPFWPVCLNTAISHCAQHLFLPTVCLSSKRLSCFWRSKIKSEAVWHLLVGFQSSHQAVRILTVLLLYKDRNRNDRNAAACLGINARITQRHADQIIRIKCI